MPKKSTRNVRFAPEMQTLEMKIAPVGVPPLLATVSLAFTPVTMAITNTVPQTSTTTVNDWVPPLDTSDVPLVPGGPG